MLHRVRHELLRAAPLALVIGGVIGAGLTRGLMEPLRQGSTFALETTSFVTAQIFSPLVVNLVWIGCCVPARVELASRIQARPGAHILGPRLATAMLAALLLLPYFILAAFTASVLASPRPDLTEQLPLFLGSLTPWVVSSAVLRTLLMAAASASLCHIIGKRCRQHPEELAALISTSIVNCALSVVLLEVFWLAVVPPSFNGRP
ncbi:ABC transporter permease [Cyanobium sp. ATX 6F1]|uniref:ABC transporter permease n=1 Tax=Cyanobium sp. ATX 6F1 TaxID=2823702 RepID=UPI0020CFCD6F|nr:hypothetical protein [Cyanobium sp. ATX 6F1]MCP9915762.1 hypothetical protein [Cyanobium sp. ATX 6F1]